MDKICYSKHNLNSISLFIFSDSYVQVILFNKNISKPPILLLEYETPHNVSSNQKQKNIFRSFFIPSFQNIKLLFEKSEYLEYQV